MPKFISVVKFVVKEGEVENFTASMKKFVNPDGVIFRKVIKTGELGVTDPASGPVIIDEQGLVTSPGGTISGKIKT